MNKIDFSKLTAEWLIENFQEITDDVSNGDYIEDVNFESNIEINLERESNSINEYEDGIKITFRVWFNRWGDFMTERRQSYITITNEGIINIRLPEALEGSDVEGELEERIKELLVIKSEEQVPLIITKFVLDRDRQINYNGQDLIANNYRCSSCKESYIITMPHHEFCPICGIHFEQREDISI